jgi:phage terminase large subunit
LKTDYIDTKRGEYFWSKPTDNPHNPPEYFEELQRLTGVFYDHLWLGKWTQSEGAIYTFYDPYIHSLAKPPDCRIDGRYIVSVDFGFTHPFSASLWQIIDGKMYQCGQVYKTRTLVEDHAVAIMQMLQAKGLNTRSVEAWICDHDAEGRSTLERRLGIHTTGAHKDVQEGIQAVNARFRSNTLFLLQDACAKPDPELEKLHLPLCTADEVPAYSWSDKKAETPIKDYDHGLDELRYAVCYIDKMHKRQMFGAKIRVKSYSYIR